MCRVWLTILGRLVTTNKIRLGPYSSVNFREDVYVLVNPQPSTNKVCTSTHLHEVTHTL